MVVTVVVQSVHIKIHIADLIMRSQALLSSFEWLIFFGAVVLRAIYLSKYGELLKLNLGKLFTKEVVE